MLACIPPEREHATYWPTPSVYHASPRSLYCFDILHPADAPYPVALRRLPAPPPRTIQPRTLRPISPGGNGTNIAELYELLRSCRRSTETSSVTAHRREVDPLHRATHSLDSRHIHQRRRDRHSQQHKESLTAVYTRTLRWTTCSHLSPNRRPLLASHATPATYVLEAD